MYISVAVVLSDIKMHLNFNPYEILEVKVD